MEILITDTGYLSTKGDQPCIGKKYSLTDSTDGSDMQNKAFHALVGEYYKSGLWSHNVKTFTEFRDVIKRDLGAGFESYIYVVIENGLPVIKKAKKLEDVPREILDSDEMKSQVLGKLKSWSAYGKKERTTTIDKLITEMILQGINSKKFNEIIDGMKGDTN